MTTFMLRRFAWFEGEGTGAGQGAGQGTGNTSTAGSQNTEHMIPKSRFDEVNNAKIAAETELEKLRTKAAADEQERLKQQGQWQQIAESATKKSEALQAQADRAAALEKAFKEGNEARLKQLPESSLPLIPVDYPPERLSAYLDANWTRLTGKPAPNIDAGAGAGGAGSGAGANGDDKLSADELAYAKAAKMTPEEYLKAKQTARQNGFRPAAHLNGSK